MARFQTYRCRGWGEYSGPCGAPDCESCHPGGAAEMARAEFEEEHIAPIQALIDELDAMVDAAWDLHFDPSGLEDERDALYEKLDEAEAEWEDPYDGPGYDLDEDRW